MRAVSFVKRLQWELPGNVFRHGLTIGDVDNDGDNELVVGTAEGELYIFKGVELWQKIAGLGLISCVAVGDVFNYGCNALVVISGDGWVHIFYSPRPVNLPGKSSGSQQATRKPRFQDRTKVNTGKELSGKMECVHVQRIPTNTKIILLADVDKDGANEMVLGLTDRVVRSYRWCSNAESDKGKLVGLNKWECADQIGTFTLHHTSDGTPTLLVAQPGGTFMRIKCKPEDYRLGDDDSSETTSEAAAEASCVDYQTLGSSRMRNPNISTEIMGDLEPGTKVYVSTIGCNAPRYVPKNSLGKQSFLDDSQLSSKNFKSSSLKFRRNHSQPEMRKSNLDIPGHFRKRDFLTQDHESVRFYSRVDSPEIDQVDGNILGGNVILGEFDEKLDKASLLPTYEHFSRNNNNSDRKDNNVVKGENVRCIGKGKPYALATLDGTIMLVQDEVILWAMQVDHQIFALCRLDVTGDGADEIVACAWDGQTYILDLQRNSVRFQFEEPVKAFCAGRYSVTPGSSSPCLVYNTFNNKILLYYDVILPTMIISSLNVIEEIDSDIKQSLNELVDSDTDTEKQGKVQQLTEWLLYGMN